MAKFVVTVLVGAALIIAQFGASQAEIPWTKDQIGNVGFAASSGSKSATCGGSVNSDYDDYAAINPAWFTNQNKIRDAFCGSNVCIHLTVGGRSITLRVKDTCSASSCSKKTDLVLSKRSFGKIASLKVPLLPHIDWQFIKC